MLGVGDDGKAVADRKRSRCDQTGLFARGRLIGVLFLGAGERKGMV